jgi:hypothetical protein
MEVSQILSPYENQFLHLHEFVMASLEVALLQTNAHGQNLVVWNFASLLPLSLPVRQVALVKGVCYRNFTLSLNPSNLVGDRAGNSLKHESTG